MQGGNHNPSHPKEREMEGGNPNPSHRPREREMEENNPNASHRPKEREMEGGNPNRSHPTPSKTNSAGEVQTTDGKSPTKLPPRPLASDRCMPSPSPCAASDKNGADSSSSRNKGKAVIDNSSSNNNNNGGIGGTGVNGQGEAEGPREQDMFMPIANVIRIMRQNLPIRAKISDDAKQTMQECVSEFISFITSEANERCHEEQRKTITAEDILWSMEKLGFDRYIEPLTLYLQRYREAEGQARGSVHDDSHCPIKRTASDAGLHAQQQPPLYPFVEPQSHYRNPLGPSFISQNPYLQQPHAFLPGGGGSSFTSGEQGPLPPQAPMALYYRGPEAPAYRDMQPPLANREVTVYQEIASGPAPAFGDVPINKDYAGASPSSQAPDPSHHAPFPSFDPYAPNK